MNKLGEQIAPILAGSVTEGALRAVVATVANSAGDLYTGAFGERIPGEAMGVDSVGTIMSMTKSVTGAAAMQLVEQGLLSVDEPAGKVCPYLKDVQVLDGFTADGQPILRAPKNPVTLRNLLTHSSGFAYDVWNKDVLRYMEATDTPSIMGLQKQSLELPLMFDPDTRWEYGIGIDWVGQMIETVTGMTLGDYFSEHIFHPLGMHDTGFQPSESMLSRMMNTYHRTPDGALVSPPEAAPIEPGQEPPPPEFEVGGGGLLSTMVDYTRFLRMILNRGALDGVRILKPETVALMSVNQMGDLRVAELKTANSAFSEDAEFFPGEPKSWGLTFQINESSCDTGRPAGTLMWAGLANSYYWIDPQNDVCGTFMTQVLPFADARSLDIYYSFESAVYNHMT